MLQRLAAVALGLSLILSPASARSDRASQTAAGPVTELDESILPPPTARRQIGHGRIFTNDFLADRGDRWQTGSYYFARVWSWKDWQGQAPGTFGDVLEMRIGGQIMTPENLQVYVPTDRPWAGKLSFGLNTHWTEDQTELALGAELVLVGPQTQLDHLQVALHELLDAPVPSQSVLSRQIGNQVWPTLVGEAGRNFDFGGNARIRPFAELRAGDESLVRVGADLTFGNFGRDELLARESVTGNRYRIVRDGSQGVSFVIGADTARLFDSVYLPSSRGYALTNARNRTRAGIHWQGEKNSVFYGVTWLGKEFIGQRISQMTGSVRLQFQF